MLNNQMIILLHPFLLWLVYQGFILQASWKILEINVNWLVLWNHGISWLSIYIYIGNSNPNWQTHILEHLLFFPFSWECHHSNWRTHIFQRGRPNHQPAKYVFIATWSLFLSRAFCWPHLNPATSSDDGLSDVVPRWRLWLKLWCVSDGKDLISNLSRIYFKI